jgi:hypothetical protein
LPPRRAYELSTTAGRSFFGGDSLRSRQRGLGSRQSFSSLGFANWGLLLNGRGPTNADDRASGAGNFLLRALTDFSFSRRLRREVFRWGFGPESRRLHNAGGAQLAAHQLSLLRRNGAAVGFERDPQLLTNLQHLPTVTPHLTGNVIESNFVGHSSASLCSFLLVSFTLQVNGNPVIGLSRTFWACGGFLRCIESSLAIL